MLRVMLIDDESRARQGLRAELEQLPDVQVCGEAESIGEAVEIIPLVRPQALFLDIRMPHGDGFALLPRLPSPLPVVFVTAHSEFAVQAFEVDAVDYLLKPVRPHRLATAVARLRHALGQSTDEPVYSDSDRICFRTPGRTVVAPVEDLILLEADGDFTRITTEGGPPLLVCRTLGSFAETLPSPPLLRLDRSLMVNVERVEAIEVSPTRGARVTLRGLSAPVELGRTALRRLREAFPQAAAELEG